MTYHAETITPQAAFIAASCFLADERERWYVRHDDPAPINLVVSTDPLLSLASFFIGHSRVISGGTLLHRPAISDDARFQYLRQEWYEERGATSSITEMANCRSYLRIMTMGPNVTKLIFRQMEQEGDEPDMWFVALQMLTGADPVTEEARGDFKAMADLWLHWGLANGYAW
jgi:hypothetical protein